jgi:flagellar biosynthesis chaperone FliJ
MALQSDRELENTQKKLGLLEQSYEEVLQEETDDEELRDAELQSLKRFINQLKEEIAWYEAHQPARR